MRKTFNPRANAARYHVQPLFEDKQRRKRRKHNHRLAKEQARLIKTINPEIGRIHAVSALLMLVILAIFIAILVTVNS